MRKNERLFSEILLCRELGITNKQLEESNLKRWVTILLASAPAQTNHHVLMWLTKRCASQGCIELTLKVFHVMGKHRIRVKPGFVWHDEEGNERGRRLDVEYPLCANHWSLNEVWTKHLLPHLAVIAQPLLSGVSRQMEDIHNDLMAWDKASRDWDPVSYGRSAIEPHEQDRYREAIDVLIDAARDAIEWLASNAPASLEAWTERLIASDVPLLRRLAIHAITVHPGRSTDTASTLSERLIGRPNWLRLVPRLLSAANATSGQTASMG